MNWKKWKKIVLLLIPIETGLFLWNFQIYTSQIFQSIYIEIFIVKLWFYLFYVNVVIFIVVLFSANIRVGLKFEIWTRVPYRRSSFN